MNSDPFPKRTTAIVVAVAGASMVAFFCLLAGSSGERAESAGADSFSRSAVGHGAFVEVLRRLGVPVAVSRFDSGRRAGDDAVLLIVEPDLDTERNRERFRRMLGTARRVLVVLPKRGSVTDPDHRGFVSKTDTLPVTTPQRQLDRLPLADQEASPVLFREEGEQVLSVPGLGHPAIVRDPQRVSGLRSLDGRDVTTARSLAGRLPSDTREILVLADPDPMANHGLGRGENAAFCLALVEILREGWRTVVVDETLHGFEVRPGLFAALLRFPLSLATAHGLFVLALLLLSASRRFGPPQPDGAGLEPGKEVLLGNTAELLRTGGHEGFVVARYYETCLSEVRRVRHVPPEFTTREAIDHLERVERARGIDAGARALGREVHEARKARRRGAPVLALARAIHHYRKEMTHGE
ncbi:MAG: DUF4350 domain-containing protein [Planctomycetes bacterium]|jgi:hypothetical protein|nr:DUF4350 domain-containing protein [Planctomycetota bacterium]